MAEDLNAVMAAAAGKKSAPRAANKQYILRAPSPSGTLLTDCQFSCWPSALVLPQSQKYIVCHAV